MMLPFDRRGDGAPIVLLHAGIADRTMWSDLLEPLAQAGHTALAVDLPGFGEARPDGQPLAHWSDVCQTMDELAIERSTLVGCSFGAAVALRVAAVHPERVSSLFLFGTPGAPDPEPSPALLAAWEQEEAALEGGDLDAAVKAVLSSWLPPGAPEELRRRVADMQRRNFELKLSTPDVEWAPDPIEEDPTILSRIDQPTLLAVGADDMVDFKDAARDLARTLPRASAVEIPECGHLIPLEAPTEFLRLLSEPALPGS